MNAHLALNLIRQALKAKAEGNEVNRYWLETIESAKSESAVSFKSWLTDKASLDMVQFTVRDGNLTKAWTPGRRQVTVKSTYVKFDESIRDFAGHRHLFHSEKVFIAVNESFGALQISVYVA